MTAAERKKLMALIREFEKRATAAADEIYKEHNMGKFHAYSYAAVELRARVAEIAPEPEADDDAPV